MVGSETEAKIEVRQLKENLPSFHEKFARMVQETINSIDLLKSNLTKFQALSVALHERRGVTHDTLHQLCDTCELLQDYPNLAKFSLQWEALVRDPYCPSVLYHQLDLTRDIECNALKH